MGCESSKRPSQLSDNPKDHSPEAFIIRIDKATRVPSMDLVGESDPYIRIRCKNKIYGRTHVKVDCPNPEWNHVFDVTGIDIKDEIDFDLWDRDRSNFNDRIGLSRISVKDLIKRPKTKMLVLRPGGSGDFVVRRDQEYLPTELHVSVIKVPAGWPEPTISQFEHGVPKVNFGKHVMIITRGTRGDVQPYCALARGLANTMGWCITICTELRYKDFVEKNAANLDRGAIRYRPSGGDTHSRIDKPIARWAMAHRSELMQMAMLARTEREFFASEPVIYYWCDMLRPDAIIYGFTMVNIAMIMSEKFQIPAVGFVLQPTTIPSEAYPPVAAIDTHFLTYFDRFERKATNHNLLQTWKKWMEDDPVWTPLSAMRERRGLRPFKGKKSETFNVLLKQKGAPIIIPINEIAFGGRPSDWPPQLEFTDFIFLQGSVVPRLSPAILGFIDKAHAAKDPVIAMTFSSMPVSRGDIIRSALRIVKECKSHPRVIALSGSKVNDPLSKALMRQLKAEVERGKILELEGAPFGLLFEHLDAVCVHGGLGTTAEAMRAGIPTTVVGVLLMDQRFWGMQCKTLGIGAPMVHIAMWKKKCVGVVDAMLQENSSMKVQAKALAKKIQPTSPDGVPENVRAIVKAIESAVPIDTRLYDKLGNPVSQLDSKSSVVSSTDSRASDASESTVHGSTIASLIMDEDQTLNDEPSESKKDLFKRISRRVRSIRGIPDLETFSMREEPKCEVDVPGDDNDEFVD